MNVRQAKKLVKKSILEWKAAGKPSGPYTSKTIPQHRYRKAATKVTTNFASKLVLGE